MDPSGIPVEMISLCNLRGELRPLRFQMEGASCQMIRVNIDQVISVKHVEYVGMEAMLYLCRARIEDREQLLELKYLVRNHSWRLSRWIS